MKIHDLSVPVVSGTDWYQDDMAPPVRVKNIGGISREGWVSHTISMAVLNGTTYIETAAHMFEDGQLLEDVPSERFLCRAFVVHAEVDGQQVQSPGEPLADFKQGEDAILLYCGWDEELDNKDFYWKSPYFSDYLQEWLLEHNPAILGGDMMSFDHPQDSSMPFLTSYFKAGGMILCPLKGLGEIAEGPVTMCAAPMRLAAVNCAPCRVFVWAEEDEE